MSKPQCKKCKGTGWYMSDWNHSTVCDECCPHDKGYWLLEENYGEDNGKLCCLAGCGKTKEVGDEWVYKVTRDALKVDKPKAP
jgi:hypothetical protein